MRLNANFLHGSQNIVKTETRTKRGNRMRKEAALGMELFSALWLKGKRRISAGCRGFGVGRRKLTNLLWHVQSRPAWRLDRSN
jgi:hypothetical protein